MELVHPAARLIDGEADAVVKPAELHAGIAEAATAYAAYPAGVVFARLPVTVPAIIRYLGAWQSGRPVALLDPGLDPAILADLVARFEPAVVTGVDAPPPAGYRAVEDVALGPVWVGAPTVPPHPDLGILLTTSGSTGNPKLVRLSRAAILANAAAIGTALRIDGDDIAPTSLALFYSYGMSVLHSHLMAGATVLVQPGDFMHRPFWQALQRHGATSLAGVPYQYEMLRRLRPDLARYPALRTFTQAGGRLRTDLVAEFHEKISAAGGRLYVMYGQTEAGPRITTLPAERLADKLGSVGPAVPGGRLSVRLDDGTETDEPGVTGEVLYRGPNVMLGYASSAADLALGDEQGGLLATGDLGHLDADGYLFLSGRLKRIAKVFGVRLNLDDVEAMLRGRGPIAAVGKDDKIIVFAEGADEATRQELVTTLADRLKLHRSGFQARAIEALPLLGNGKPDYRTLESQA